MPEIKRASIDRRSGEDCRVVYNLDYFRNGGLERRKGKDRRTKGERRFGWVRVSKWSSVNIRELKLPSMYIR
jgi:hypothetical protein